VRSFQKQGFDVSDGTTRAAEAYAFGNAVAIIWACNERLRGNDVPQRMLETLPTYETILRTRPAPEDTDIARRAAVAAKLRGISGQWTAEDIEGVCRALLGSAYEGLRFVDPLKEFSYWPGMNPGPPGFEWTSNRATIGIAVRQDSRSDAAWGRVLSQLRDLLNTLPSWEVYEIGTDDDGFTVGDGPDAGIVGVTYL
jgi:hypothetical protein